jgi:hypothetical protein
MVSQTNTLLLCLLVTLCDGLVNEDAVAKRKAKAKAKASYVERHGTVMDTYGRVLRWGRRPLKIECVKKKTGRWTCSVTKHEVRKYRTKEEEHNMRVLQSAKQEELDRRSGSTSASDKKKVVNKRLERQKCGLFRDWLKNYDGDATPNHGGFYNWLVANYQDFGDLRRLGSNRRSVRKAKKLYRHIALHTHADKIPKLCQEQELLSMMAEILGKANSLKACVEEPHTCDENRGL